MHLYLNILCVFLLISVTVAQREYSVKPGDCPPATTIGICMTTCRRDVDCSGVEKCCPTNCGGTSCIAPVTMRKLTGRTDKPGRCPARPSGAWVCSSTCALDSDCRGKLKCCRGKCPNSMACTKPSEI